MRALPILLALILTGCVSLLRTPPLPESEAQLRVRRALLDLEDAGFALPPGFRLDWSDRTVRCAAGNVCISPMVGDGSGGTLIVAPEVLLSDARLRLSLLEVWQRLIDGGSMKGPPALARSTLRQLLSGESIGVSDPVLLGEVLAAYEGYRERLPPEGRSGLPDPRTYSRELGMFLVPVPLERPGDLESPSFAPRGLGAVTVDLCENAPLHVHPGVGGWEGRREYWRAVCAEERRDEMGVLLHLLNAERLLPHDPRVPLALGEAMCRSGLHRPAVLAFERAAAKSPDPAERADALRGLARCHLAHGLYPQAREAYGRALRVDSEDVVTSAWVQWLEERGILPVLP